MGYVTQYPGFKNPILIHIKSERFQNKNFCSCTAHSMRWNADKEREEAKITEILISPFLLLLLPTHLDVQTNKRKNKGSWYSSTYLELIWMLFQASTLFNVHGEENKWERQEYQHDYKFSFFMCVHFPTQLNHFVYFKFVFLSSVATTYIE